MNIVKFHGGLGNQLFQYGLYRKLKIIGKKVKADVSWYNGNKAESDRDFELAEFGIELNKCNKFEVGLRDNIVVRLLKKYFNFSTFLFQEETSGKFVPEVFKVKNKLLEGYWQSEEYFKDIRSVLLKELVFPQTVTCKEERILERVRKTESVSVHIRRGDYLNHQDKYGNICTEGYYIKAIQYMKTKITNPVFFVFSDDMAWSREFLKGYSNVEFVELGESVKSIHDMKLMAACKYNIIANSSFSWWASWLNQNPDKIVIAPGRWRNDCISEDIMCENWIKMLPE